MLKSELVPHLRMDFLLGRVCYRKLRRLRDSISQIDSMLEFRPQIAPSDHTTDITSHCCSLDRAIWSIMVGLGLFVNEDQWSLGGR